MPINSRQKGAAGEREFAHKLKEDGFEARRGQQFSGSPDSPDVVSNLPFHFEVKRVENLSLYKAMEQAKRDTVEGKPPVVAHRRNKEEWLVVMRYDDWIKLVKKTDPPSKVKPVRRIRRRS